MKNKFKDIDDALEINRDVEETAIVSSMDNNSIKKSDDIDDYEYTRGSLYSLIEKGKEAIDGIMEVAQQSDSPRAYEVASQLIKSVADTTDKLIDLQQKMKKLKEEDFSTPKNVTNNALFVGSTADLQKILKQGFKDSK